MQSTPELREVIVHTLSFHGFRQYYTFDLSIQHGLPLVDVLLSLHGACDGEGRSISGIHIYLNDLDLTAAVQSSFAAALAKDASRVKTQYKAALAKHIARYPSGATGGESPSAMNALGSKLLAGDLAGQVKDQLGDHRLGWAGHLGIINFLYEDIDFPPLSVSDLLNTYNSGKGTSETLTRAGKCRITVSSGSIDDPSASKVGALALRLEVMRQNPLSDKVDSLIEEVKLVQEQIKEIGLQSKDLQEAIETLKIAASDLGNRVTNLDKALAENTEGQKDLTGRVQSLEVAGPNDLQHVHEIKLVRSDGTTSIHLSGDTGDIVLYDV